MSAHTTYIQHHTDGSIQQNKEEEKKRHTDWKWKNTLFLDDVINYVENPTESTKRPLELINESWDFPGGPVVKNPPSNAGDTSSIPGWRTKIPHAAGQLSPGATNYWAHAPQLDSPRATNYNSATKPGRHDYRAHVLWSPRATTKDLVCRN